MGVWPFQIQLANHDILLNCNDFNWIRITTGRIENYRNLFGMRGRALQLGLSLSLAQAAEFLKGEKPPWAVLSIMYGLLKSSFNLQTSIWKPVIDVVAQPAVLCVYSASKIWLCAIPPLHLVVWRGFCTSERGLWVTSKSLMLSTSLTYAEWRPLGSAFLSDCHSRMQDL